MYRGGVAIVRVQIRRSKLSSAMVFSWSSAQVSINEDRNSEKVWGLICFRTLLSMSGSSIGLTIYPSASAPLSVLDEHKKCNLDISGETHFVDFGLLSIGTHDILYNELFCVNSKKLNRELVN